MGWGWGWGDHLPLVHDLERVRHLGRLVQHQPDLREGAHPDGLTKLEVSEVEDAMLYLAPLHLDREALLVRVRVKGGW